MKKFNFKPFLLTFCLFVLSLLLVACEQTIGSLSINSASERSVEKGSAISIAITRTQIPTEATISWLTNKEGVVTLLPSNDNHSCEITANQKGVVAVVVTYSSSEGQAVATVVITVLDTAGDLSAAKQSKIVALADLLEYDENDYRASDWEALCNYILAAENSINALSTLNDVKNFDIQAVKAECDAVITSAGHTAAELAQAKQQKILELDELLDEYNQSNYTLQNWEVLSSYIDDAKAIVSAATALSAVTSFDIDAVEVLCNSVGVKMTYSVKHLFETLELSSPLSYDLCLTQTLQGSAGESTAATALSLPGFVANAITQSTLVKDTITEIEVKYNRQTFSYSISSAFGSVKLGGEILSSVQVRFGSDFSANENILIADAAVLCFEVPENSQEHVYTFTGWNISASASDLAATERSLFPNITRQSTAAQVDNAFYASFYQANDVASSIQTIILHSDFTVENDLEVYAKISLSHYCLTVESGKELLLHNGIEKDNGSLINNGTITNFISSRQQYLDATDYSQNIILKKDIFTDTQSRIMAETRDYSFTLDLNGFNFIGGSLSFANRKAVDGIQKRFNFSINVIIKDSSGNNGQIGSLTDYSVLYGIIVIGDSKISLTLDGVICCGFYGGIATNGLDQGDFSNATITGINSHFIGGNPVDSNDRLGAYFPANHIYTFTDCVFEGATSIHIKSGCLTLTNCTLIANGDYANPLYYGNGANVTGNALMAEATKGYGKRLQIIISDSELSSTNGYTITQAAFSGVETNPSTGLRTNVLMSAQDVEEYGISILAANCVLSGKLGEVSSQNGKVSVTVNSYDQLLTMMKNDKICMVLTDDIEVPVVSGYQDFDINAFSRDYTFVLDLDGYHLKGEINFRDKDGYKITATIKNGLIGSYESVVWYGILMGGNNLDLKFENIISKGFYGGIYSNGTFAHSTVSATACEFGALNDDGDSLGGYLAANFTYTFTDCVFEGAGGGIHIKSGTLILNDCILIATGEYAEPSYHGSGANVTGNALTVEPTVGYNQTLSVEINGGLLSSVHGFAIEEKASAKEGTIPVCYVSEIIVTDATLISGQASTTQSESDIITLINCIENPPE